ncbi:MAG TPA: pilus assembly protein PilM [Parcubacteria group bacterium]|nr:pilus assembly protein PilM [Parcubacteria group bacterium]
MKLFDIFPTPRFLTLTDAGVSISERTVRYISFRPSGSGDLHIELSGEIALPEGVVSQGEVKDKEKLVEVLSTLSRDKGIKFVKATLPEERAYLFTTKVDRVPYKDLRDAVAFLIEENAPVSLSKSLFSFEILDNPEDFKVAVSVLPTDVAQTYIETFEAAGLTPVSFDIESQAISRSLVKRGDERAHLIIYLGHNRVGFYLVNDGVVQFSTTMLIDVADSENPETIKALKLEIRKFFSFWSSKVDAGSVPNQKVERIIIGGPWAKDEKLVSSIMSDVETPYSLGNVWINVSDIEKRLPDMSFEESLAYAAAVGAALRGGREEYV